MPSKKKALGATILAALALSALWASAAGGTEVIEFRSEAEHTNLVGTATGNQVFTAGAIELRCEEAVFAGTFEAASKSTEEVALLPAFGKCKLIEGETVVVADVEVGNCLFTLAISTETSAGGVFDGPAGLECEKAKEAITVIATQFGSEFACMSIPPQSPGGGAGYTLEGEGKSAQIAIDFGLTGLKYTLEGICGEGEAENGTYAGEVYLTGQNKSEEQIGIHIKSRDRFHSGSDKTSLTAEALGTQLFETGAGLKLECKEASFQEGTTVGTEQSEFTAGPGYGECSLVVPEVGSFNAKVEPKSCGYVLVAEGDVEGEGEARIACETEGDKIEVKVEFVPPFLSKCMQIPAQEPEASTLSYENKGSAATRTVDVDASLEGLEYTLEGACGEETLSDASFDGEVSISGEDEEGHVGFWLGRFGKFVSGSDETTLTGEALSTQEFVTPELKMSCATLTFAETTIGTEQETITARPAYSECTLTVPGIASVNGKVEMHECVYVFGVEVQTSIQCPEASKIELRGEFVPPFISKCVDIFGQVPGSPTVDYANDGSGSTMGFDIESTMEGIEYTKTGICGSETASDMSYAGTISVTGEDAEANHVPVTLE